MNSIHRLTVAFVLFLPPPPTNSLMMNVINIRSDRAMCIRSFYRSMTKCMGLKRVMGSSMR